MQTITKVALDAMGGDNAPAEIVKGAVQDFLKLGNEARMNQPATVGYNWRWRLNKEQLEAGRRAWIRNLAAVYRR